MGLKYTWQTKFKLWLLIPCTKSHYFAVVSRSAMPFGLGPVPTIVVSVDLKLTAMYLLSVVAAILSAEL